MDSKEERTIYYRILYSRWKVGSLDRGHGHIDYAVLTENEDLVVVECSNHGLAGHIVSLHNNNLESLI